MGERKNKLYFYGGQLMSNTIMNNIKIGARRQLGFPTLKCEEGELLWCATIQKTNRTNSPIFFSKEFCIHKDAMVDTDITAITYKEYLKTDLDPHTKSRLSLDYIIITWFYGKYDNGMWLQESYPPNPLHFNYKIEWIK